jgi:5'-methylthioadenosine phosphorylase
MQAEIGIIGGTGLYDPKLLKNVQEVEVNTPFGAPSSPFTIGELAGKRVAFLARHGPKHTIRPPDVNSRKHLCFQKARRPKNLGLVNCWLS